MAPPLPMVGAGRAGAGGDGALEKADAAVVVADGRPTGVITRQDVLAFLST
jgi:cystathionine beta-synthase